MPVKNIMDENKQRMIKSLDLLKSELKAVRTGRASTGLVENLSVEYYGSPTPLKQLATFATPQADSIIIKPFDPGSIKDIEKAIKNSDLSLAPISEGKVIRLNVPALSQERRQQIVSQLKSLGEQAKVSVRNIRRELIKALEKDEKEKLITEDDLDKGKKQADDITKEFSDKIDTAIEEKSQEILSD